MLSIAEVIAKAQELETEEEKIEWLRRNDSEPLKQLLICNYDTDRIKFLIPSDTPPYKPSDHLDSQGMLYRQVRKLRYVIAGEDFNISQYKREHLFIEMLESIDAGDAELLCKIIKQKPLTGLPVSTINKAFGVIIPSKFEETEEEAPKTNETKPVKKPSTRSRKKKES